MTRVGSLISCWRPYTSAISVKRRELLSELGELTLNSFPQKYNTQDLQNPSYQQAPRTNRIYQHWNQGVDTSWQREKAWKRGL